MKPAAAYLPKNSRPPTTVRLPTSPRPVTQQTKSPDSLGRSSLDMESSGWDVGRTLTLIARLRATVLEIGQSVLKPPDGTVR